MLFDTLKKNCASQIYNSHPGVYEVAAIESVKLIKAGKMPKRFETIEKVKNEAYDMVMRTDIRNVKSLSEQFPTIVPYWVKNGMYAPELTDNGWELIQLK